MRSRAVARLSVLSHSVALRIALALLCLAGPGVLRAQDTTRAPAGTTGGVSLPAGTRVTRPPLSAPPVVTRPPADATAADQQQLVTVPDLAGSTVEQARRLLAAAGLEVGRVAEGTGSGTPGTVIQQQPRAGSAVAAKSDVRLWLAPQAATTTRPPPSRPSAIPLVTVPRLAGRTVEDARATLARINLQVGAVAELAGSGAPGTIVRQSPQPGFPVLEGSSVRVWIVPARVAAQPRDTPVAAMVVRVPSVVGRTVEDARETLSAAGLAVGAVDEAPGTGRPGTVRRQQPAAGSAMLPNSRVRLWLVPVQVATRPDPSPPARPQPQPPVQRPPVQDPAPATQPVTTPPAPVQPTPAPALVDSAAVPDVRRLALAQAQASLSAAGFAVAFDTALADSIRWTVSAQQPSAGARLEAGGVVALLLDPPAAPVAAAPATPPPPVSGVQQAAEEPVAPAPGRRTLWISLAALLLVAAAAAGAQRMWARARVLPVTAVSARVRMDSPARVFVEGAPFGDARLRFRMNPGRTDARVSAAGPLFVRKEVAGD